MQVDPDSPVAFVVRFGDSSRMTFMVEANNSPAVSRQVYSSVLNINVS